ncbi:MAG: SRPBCC domain-containing protein [Pyrinomonadaceae bacterium]
MNNEDSYAIHHDVPIGAAPDVVFDLVSTPLGLSEWWSKSASGFREQDAVYDFDFGPGYRWKGRVCKLSLEGRLFALEMFEADSDWNKTVVRFSVSERGNSSLLGFEHAGWSENNAHFRTSSYCWAMYLRCLKLHAEKGLVYRYEDRFDGIPVG